MLKTQSVSALIAKPNCREIGYLLLMENGDDASQRVQKPLARALTTFEHFANVYHSDDYPEAD